MERPTPVLLTALPGPISERETRTLALCDDHLAREETLLGELLQSLRQVRDAFFQRNLNILPTLQSRQKQLAQEAIEMAAARDQLRTALADVLGVSVAEATLRAAAMSLSPPARDRLLERRGRFITLLQEAEQLTQQNATLLGYARGFFACLFAGLTDADISERYGRPGDRGVPSAPPLRVGTFLEARV